MGGTKHRGLWGEGAVGHSCRSSFFAGGRNQVRAPGGRGAPRGRGLGSNLRGPAAPSAGLSEGRRWGGGGGRGALRARRCGGPRGAGPVRPAGGCPSRGTPALCEDRTAPLRGFSLRRARGGRSPGRGGEGPARPTRFLRKTWRARPGPARVRVTSVLPRHGLARWTFPGPGPRRRRTRRCGAAPRGGASAGHRPRSGGQKENFFRSAGLHPRALY